MQIHHWKFDEGSGALAADAVGARNLGLTVLDTFAAGRLTATSLSGKAVSGSFPVTSPTVTIMGWVRPKTMSGNVPLFGWWSDDTTTTTQLAIWALRTDGFGPAGVMQGNIRLGGALQPVPGVALDLGIWQHVALTYDGTTAVLYRNGVEVGSLTASGALPTTSVFSAYGDRADIDDLRIFDTALTPAEVVTWKDTADQPAPDPDPDPTPDPGPTPLPPPVLSGDLEIDMQRKLTNAFINTMPEAITLTPRARERQPTGGVKWVAQTPRVEQTMRLVEPSSAPLIVTGADGVQRLIEFMLIGAWDADIGQYDVFTMDGRDWEVVSLYHFNGWERRAQVARYG